MIKHKCNLIKLFRYDGITFGDHVFLSDEGYNDEKLLKHEAIHIEQYKRYGFIGFLIRYIYYHFKYGYQKNPLEIEAKERSEKYA